VIANSGLYAYGLVDKSPQQLDMLGIDKKSKVYPVKGRGICVMVSEIDVDQFQNQVKNLIAELNKNVEVQNNTAEILQAHENIIDTLMQETTVVPLKFGTILKDENSALKMLENDEEKFKSLLAKFRGKVEWGLKVYADKQSLRRYIIHSDPKFMYLEDKQKKMSRGAAYLLGRKMEEEIEDHVVDQFTQVAEEIFQACGKDAVEAKLNDTLPQKVTGKKKEMILNAAYLVEREKGDHLQQRGQSFRDKYAFLGLDLEFSGPWPPYNFIEGQPYDEESEEHND
jgi:hypothetical protein